MAKRKPFEPRETQIQNSILDILAHCGIYAFRQNSGAADIEKETKRGRKKYHVKFSVPGISDIVAFYRGKVWFLEVKKPGEKQNENQKAFQARCVENGIEYHVVHSPEETLAILDGIHNRRDGVLAEMLAYHTQAARKWEENNRPEGAEPHRKFMDVIRSLLPDTSKARPIFRNHQGRLYPDQVKRPVTG